MSKSVSLWSLLCGLTLLLGVSLLPACGSGDVGLDGRLVGGSCRSHADCDFGARCLRDGKRFPSGTCAQACDDDSMCPSGSVCIDRDGGVCLLFCEVNADCRAEYICDREDREGAGGDEFVCIGAD